ncbi:MAG: hypothetical protein ABI847_14195, partial [Anaerolineales bacterium]
MRNHWLGFVGRVGVAGVILLAAVLAVAAPIVRAAGPFTVTPDTVSNTNSTTLVIQRGEGGFTPGSVVAVDHVG